MFTLGVQKLPPTSPALFMARASVEIVAPIAAHSVSFQACDVVTTCGNDVAPGMAGEYDTPGDDATPGGRHARGGRGGRSH